MAHYLNDRSGGSVQIAALFHVGLNVGSPTLAGHGSAGALASTGVMIWAALIVVDFLLARRRTRTATTSADFPARPTERRARDPAPPS